MWKKKDGEQADVQIYVCIHKKVESGRQIGRKVESGREIGRKIEGERQVERQRHEVNEMLQAIITDIL